ncbi:hypothetical protein [Alkalinema sp. FACHB-956]|uniref:hypothetical protein n=1 Tax=Alkalinema sp. FACHB-956 TaxID=2692768 RepID=UPI001685E833|nr:hypothetical protein [Alkalinema sp. FACHB-956]MBD2327788.1 hypothetical protein [Alkalinema sp. FACHB-956]
MFVYPELLQLDEQRLIQRWEQPSPAGEDPFTYYTEIAQALLDRMVAALPALTEDLEEDESWRTTALLLLIHSYYVPRSDLKSDPESAPHSDPKEVPSGGNCGQDSSPSA